LALGRTAARQTPIKEELVLKRVLGVVAVSAVMAVGAATPAGAQPPDQSGLVNVAVVDVLNNNNVVANVQVPVGIAANVCNVDLLVLAQQRPAASRSCTANAQGTADATNIIRSLPPAFQP